MKIIMSYISIFALLTLFALFLDARSGIFVIIIFLTAIALSAILHIYAVSVFDCEIFADSELVEKGDSFALCVTVIKRKSRIPAFLLPTVFEITLDLSEHLTPGDCSCLTHATTFSTHEKQQTFRLNAVFWGKAKVGIAKVRAIDILGIFTALTAFRADSKIYEDNMVQVKIFPGIPALSPHAEFVRTLEAASAFADSESTREVSFAMTGFPGYEHRDYIPGDPLKSVNWKLSAKRERLLVRKPEAYAGGDQVLVLDKGAFVSGGGITTTRDRLVCEQAAIEGVLALSLSLTRREILCRVYVHFDEGWRVYSLQNDSDVEKLRFALCDYSFAETFAYGRIPDTLADESGSGLAVFTARPDAELRELCFPLRQKGIIPEILSAAEGSANNRYIREINGEMVFEGVGES
jgi:hypothetical protein